MRLGAYLILMFSLSIGLYMFGEVPVVMALTSSYNLQGGSTLMVGVSSGANVGQLQNNAVIDKIVSVLIPTVGVTGILAATAVLFMGFGAIYIIPVLIVVALLNLFIFPFSFLVTGTMPDFIAMPLAIFLNLLLVLSIVSFVRGGV